MASPGRGGRAAAIAIVAALVLVVIGDFVASLAGARINWLVSLLTAAIVGGFLALLLVRPRKPKPAQADGFTVED